MKLPGGKTLASARTQSSVTADTARLRGRALHPRGHGASARTQPSVRIHSLPSPPLPSLPCPLPYGRSLLSARMRTRTLEKKKFFYIIF
jgi:hypothetical protein